MKGTGQTPVWAVVRIGDEWMEYGCQRQPVQWYYIVRRPQGSTRWEQAPEFPNCFSHRYHAGRAFTTRYPFPDSYLHPHIRALAVQALREALQGGLAG